MSYSHSENSYYQPIENYGVIGNLETIALVGIHGSIDFMCFPRFDSPSIFARLLDFKKGGHFSIQPTQKEFTSKQMYLPDTNILVTRFLSAEGILEVIDFMPIIENSTNNSLARIVKCVQGSIQVDMECFCRFNYGQNNSIVNDIEKSDNTYDKCYKSGENVDEEISPIKRYGLKFSDETQENYAYLFSDSYLSKHSDSAKANFKLTQGEQTEFLFVCGNKSTAKPHSELSQLPRVLDKTTKFWRSWINQSQYIGLWRDQVIRSALLLKLLFSRDYGSIVAAPTFSLPETIGGQRNWDYRFCWIRDSAFTVYALLNLGFSEEASSYIRWITKRYEQCDECGKLNLMYRLNGDEAYEEEHLDHLEGYRKSKPVRIGNKAKHQLQLDIYGELIDSIYLANKHNMAVTYNAWNNMTKTVDYVCANWTRPDEGIWEFRGGRRKFLHSRLMCWVAIDRALKISEKSSFPAPTEKWRKERDDIYADIHENFWDTEREAFVQYKGAHKVDASVLLMTMVKFISPLDPRWQSTMKAIKRDLVSDSFVKRYIPENSLEGKRFDEEGNFTMCSFWYCENLARMGQVDEATLLFEKMLGYANHLGIYSEQLSMQGQHLGNFPQAFTHMALVSAAIAINKAKNKRPM